MSSLAKIPVAVTHRGSAPLGRAIRYYAFSRQRSGRPRATAGSGRIEPPEIEPAHTAGECRTPTTVFPDDLGSVNAIAIDLSAGSGPAELGTLLVTNPSSPGVRNQAGADPGRGCPRASRPRSPTRRRPSPRA